MSIFDSQAYQRASGQQPTGLFDWATKNYDNAMAGNPTQHPRQQPINLPNPHANYNARVVAAGIPGGMTSESFYDDAVPLGNPNGSMIPGENFNRINEIGSSVRPIPSPGEMGLVSFGSGVRNNTALNGPGMTGDDYENYQAPTQLNLPVIDEHTNAYGTADNALTKAVSNKKPKGKKAKNEQKAIRGKITKQANTQQAVINAAAGVAPVPQSNRRKEIDIHGNLVQSNINNSAGGAGSLSPEQDRILSMF